MKIDIDFEQCEADIRRIQERQAEIDQMIAQFVKIKPNLPPKPNHYPDPKIKLLKEFYVTAKSGAKKPSLSILLEGLVESRISNEDANNLVESIFDGEQNLMEMVMNRNFETIMLLVETYRGLPMSMPNPRSPVYEQLNDSKRETDMRNTEEWRGQFSSAVFTNSKGLRVPDLNRSLENLKKSLVSDKFLREKLKIQSISCDNIKPDESQNVVEEGNCKEEKLAPLTLSPFLPQEILHHPNMLNKFTFTHSYIGLQKNGEANAEAQPNGLKEAESVLMNLPQRSMLEGQFIPDKQYEISASYYPINNKQELNETSNLICDESVPKSEAVINPNNKSPMGDKIYKSRFAFHSPSHSARKSPAKNPRNLDDLCKMTKSSNLSPNVNDLKKKRFFNNDGIEEEVGNAQKSPRSPSNTSRESYQKSANSPVDFEITPENSNKSPIQSRNSSKPKKNELKHSLFVTGHGNSSNSKANIQTQKSMNSQLVTIRDFANPDVIGVQKPDILASERNTDIVGQTKKETRNSSFAMGERRQAHLSITTPDIVQANSSAALLMRSNSLEKIENGLGQPAIQANEESNKKSGQLDSSRPQQNGHVKKQSSIDFDAKIALPKKGSSVADISAFVPRKPPMKIKSTDKLDTSHNIIRPGSVHERKISVASPDFDQIRELLRASTSKPDPQKQEDEKRKSSERIKEGFIKAAQNDRRKNLNLKSESGVDSKMDIMISLYSNKSSTKGNQISAQRSFMKPKQATKLDNSIVSQRQKDQIHSSFLIKVPEKQTKSSYMPFKALKTHSENTLTKDAKGVSQKGSVTNIQKNESILSNKPNVLDEPATPRITSIANLQSASDRRAPVESPEVFANTSVQDLPNDTKISTPKQKALAVEKSEISLGNIARPIPRAQSYSFRGSKETLPTNVTTRPGGSIRSISQLGSQPQKPRSSSRSIKEMVKKTINESPFNDKRQYEVDQVQKSLHNIIFRFSDVKDKSQTSLNNSKFNLSSKPPIETSMNEIAPSNTSVVNNKLIFESSLRNPGIASPEKPAPELNHLSANVQRKHFIEYDQAFFNNKLFNA